MWSRWFKAAKTDPSTSSPSLPPSSSPSTSSPSDPVNPISKDPLPEDDFVVLNLKMEGQINIIDNYDQSSTSSVTPVEPSPPVVPDLPPLPSNSLPPLPCLLPLTDLQSLHQPDLPSFLTPVPCLPHPLPPLPSLQPSPPTPPLESQPLVIMLNELAAEVRRRMIMLQLQYPFNPLPVTDLSHNPPSYTEPIEVISPQFHTSDEEYTSRSSSPDSPSYIWSPLENFIQHLLDEADRIIVRVEDEALKVKQRIENCNVCN